MYSDTPVPHSNYLTINELSSTYKSNLTVFKSLLSIHKLGYIFTSSLCLLLLYTSYSRLKPGCTPMRKALINFERTFFPGQLTSVGCDRSRQKQPDASSLVPSIFQVPNYLCPSLQSSELQ